MKEDKREEQEKNETDLLHLTRDTLTKGDKKKTKKKTHEKACQLSLSETREPPAWLELLLNCSSLLDFFLDHCLQRTHSYTVVLTKFSMRLCSSLRANSVRGLILTLTFL